MPRRLVGLRRPVAAAPVSSPGALRPLSAAQARRLQRSVGAYFAFQAFHGANFAWPVFVAFYQRVVGLGLPEILYLQSFHTVVRVALELPLGVFADRVGRRASLAVSAGAQALACVILLSMPWWPAVLAAEVCFAVAVAARSGADGALLFDLLAAHGRTVDYPRIEGRAQSLMAVAGASAALASGFLASIWLALPYAATLATSIAALLAAGLLTEADGRRAVSARHALGGAWRDLRGSSAVRWLVVLYALLVVLSHGVFYLQQPYFEAVDLPIAWFGVLVAATKLVHALVARRAGEIEALLGPRRAPAFLIVGALLPLTILWLVRAPWAAGAVLLRGIPDALLQPVTQFHLSRLVRRESRATLLSSASFLARLGQAVVLALAGLAIEKWGLGAALGGIVVAGGLVGGLLVAAGEGRNGGPQGGAASGELGGVGSARVTQGGIDARRWSNGHGGTPTVAG